jgi:hypothetical protein
MTKVLYTVDTELSPGLHQRGLSALENFRISVMGEVADGAWGIGHQIARLNAHGLKGVFFVEALCARMFGPDVLKRIVDPILAGGHEVQLHIHTEWLQWIEEDIVGRRRGEDIADFTQADQRRLLECGLDALEQAGAPRPIAFRAGNYGANNDTLRALASLGVTYDSSYDFPFLGRPCAIQTDQPLHGPADVDGMLEIPVTFFEDYPGHVRHLQLCAVSHAELKWVIENSIAGGRPTTTVVSHSFELLNVKKTRANALMLKRFDRFCALMQSLKGAARSATFSDLDVAQPRNRGRSTLKSNVGRTVVRMLEQSAGTVLYDLA